MSYLIKTIQNPILISLTDILDQCATHLLRATYLNIHTPKKENVIQQNCRFSLIKRGEYIFVSHQNKNVHSIDFVTETISGEDEKGHTVSFLTAKLSETKREKHRKLDNIYPLS